MLNRTRKVQQSGSTFWIQLTEHLKEIGITEKGQEVEVSINPKTNKIEIKKQGDQ